LINLFKLLSILISLSFSYLKMSYKLECAFKIVHSKPSLFEFVHQYHLNWRSLLKSDSSSIFKCFFNNSMETLAFGSTLVETMIHWTFVPSSNLVPIGKLRIFVDLEQIKTSIVPSKTLVRTCHQMCFEFLGIK